MSRGLFICICVSYVSCLISTFSSFKLLNKFNLYPLCSRKFLISVIIGLIRSLNMLSISFTLTKVLNSEVIVIKPSSSNSQIND